MTKTAMSLPDLRISSKYENPGVSLRIDEYRAEDYDAEGQPLEDHRNDLTGKRRTKHEIGFERKDFNSDRGLESPPAQVLVART